MGFRIMTCSCISPVCVCDHAGGISCKAAEAGHAKSCHLPRNNSQVPCRAVALTCWCLVARFLTVAHITEQAATAAQIAVAAYACPKSIYLPVVLSAQHADMNCMFTALESSLQDCLRLWCRAAPAEEVYSFRQITQYAAFTPDTLSSIASALKAFGIWQVCHLPHDHLGQASCTWGLFHVDAAM